MSMTLGALPLIRVWSAGSVPKKRKVQEGGRNFALLPGPPSLFEVKVRLLSRSLPRGSLRWRFFGLA